MKGDMLHHLLPLAYYTRNYYTQKRLRTFAEVKDCTFVPHRDRCESNMKWEHKIRIPGIVIMIPHGKAHRSFDYFPTNRIF